MNFINVGFDFRVWPWAGYFSAGESEWEQASSVYNEIKSQFSLEENEYQLLAINGNVALHEIIEISSKIENCNLVSISLPSEIVNLMDRRHGFSTGLTIVDLSKFLCRGYDVCDYNGFFSIIGHPNLDPNYLSMASEDELIKALSLVQIANAFDPQHAPYVAVKIHTLK